MVSFWPWGSTDSSPASFEKALSALSKKIAENQSRLEYLRMRGRKTKVLGTLYLSFAYLIYAIVLLIAVGYKNLGPYEWTGVALGPMLIVSSRQIIAAYYNFRIEGFESHLTELNDERSKTIQKLKDATKYDSTMELIEKYGGVDNRPISRGGPDLDHSDGEGKRMSPGKPPPGFANRTHMAPPATANIQRRVSGSSVAGGSRPVTPVNQTGKVLEPSAEFAPNAYGNSPQRQSSAQIPPQQPMQPQFPPENYYAGPAESHWYDRIFDVLLGEDETAAKNRIVLLCKSCRLVNGQAPPGVKSLAELGMWRCMACGTPNGEMDEGTRIVKEVLAKANNDKNGRAAEHKIIVEDADIVNTGSEANAESNGSIKSRKSKKTHREEKS